LSAEEHLELYLRRTFTAKGIYLKSALFALRDQSRDATPAWGGGFAGFSKRFGTRQAEFVIQNSVIAAGDGTLAWEPRDDRCHCGGDQSRAQAAQASLIKGSRGQA